MLLDDELFDRAMAYQEGRLSITGFMRFLQAHDTVASRDMYNELQYYNTEDKIQEKRQPIKAIRDAVIDPFTILDKSRNALQGVRN
jgi:succinate dehydrogenase/fumarate reductase flavoprotein subunit